MHGADVSQLYFHVDPAFTFLRPCISAKCHALEDHHKHA